MFRSITSFFFGGEDKEECVEKEESGKDAISSSKPGEFLDPADWVVVERDYRSAATDLNCSNETEFRMSESGDRLSFAEISASKLNSLADSCSEEHFEFERLCGPYVDMRDLDVQNDTALSDVSSQPEILYNPSIEECWIVSPCPCFTGQEASAERSRSTSMENLLIEHPSMSIYELGGRRPLRERTEGARFVEPSAPLALPEGLCSPSGSMENLSFHRPRERVFVARNRHLVQSPVWTSDSESSSLDRSFSKAGTDPMVVVVSMNEENEEQRQQNGNENANCHSSSGRGGLPFKCSGRIPMRLSHNNLERSGKGLQQQARKKRRNHHKASRSSSFNSHAGKKKN